MIRPALVLRFMKDESGATAIEYSLVAALIALVSVSTVGNLGGHLNAPFAEASAALHKPDDWCRAPSWVPDHVQCATDSPP